MKHFSNELAQHHDDHAAAEPRLRAGSFDDWHAPLVEPVTTWSAASSEHDGSDVAYPITLRD